MLTTHHEKWPTTADPQRTPVNGPEHVSLDQNPDPSWPVSPQLWNHHLWLDDPVFPSSVWPGVSTSRRTIPKRPNSMQWFGALSLSCSFLLGASGIIIKARPGHDLSWSHKSLILGKKLKSLLPLSSNNEAKNFLFPRQVACIKDHAEFILREKKVTFGASQHSKLKCYSLLQFMTSGCSVARQAVWFMHLFLMVRPEIQLKQQKPAQSPLWKEACCPFQQLRFSLGSNMLELLNQDFLNFTHTPSSQFLPHLLIVSPVISTL